MGSLDGRVAIVTGAGRGIGREHALLLAAEGARVVVNDLGGGTDGSGASQSPAEEVAAEIRARGGQAVADGHDVADWEGAGALIQQAIKTFGDLHVLVNNAGILRDRVLVNLSEQDWDVSIRVNLRGHFVPSRWAANYWREQSKGGKQLRATIINTSSESGVFANAGQSNYAAAKAGVATLTQVWAKELGRYGVRVNALVPRARTRLTESGLPNSDVMKAREGVFDIWDPANISPFIAYLATEDCPLSGEVLLVAGGVVQRARPWELDPRWKLTSDRRWTVDALKKAVAEAGPLPAKGDTGMVR